MRVYLFKERRSISRVADPVILIGGATVGISMLATGGFSPFVLILFAFSLAPIVVFALVIPAVAEKQQKLEILVGAGFLSFVAWLYLSTAIDVAASDSSTRGIEFLFLPCYVFGAVAISIVGAWAFRSHHANSSASTPGDEQTDDVGRR